MRALTHKLDQGRVATNRTNKANITGRPQNGPKRGQSWLLVKVAEAKSPSHSLVRSFFGQIHSIGSEHFSQAGCSSCSCQEMAGHPPAPKLGLGSFRVLSGHPIFGILSTKSDLIPSQKGRASACGVPSLPRSIKPLDH